MNYQEWHETYIMTIWSWTKSYFWDISKLILHLPCSIPTCCFHRTPPPHTHTHTCTHTYTHTHTGIHRIHSTCIKHCTFDHYNFRDLYFVSFHMDLENSHQLLKNKLTEVETLQEDPDTATKRKWNRFLNPLGKLSQWNAVVMEYGPNEI